MPRRQLRQLDYVARYPEYLAGYVGDPLLFEGVAFGRLDEVGDGACPAVLHHQPQLVVLGLLLDKCSVIRGYVSGKQSGTIGRRQLPLFHTSNEC